MGRGLSSMQVSILQLIRGRSAQGKVTTTLDILDTLGHKRDSQTRRKSVWRALRSLERRGLISVHSPSGERRRDSSGCLRWTVVEVSNEA